MAKTILDSEPLEDHTPRAVDGNNAIEIRRQGSPHHRESPRPVHPALSGLSCWSLVQSRPLLRESCHPVGPCPGLSQSFLRGCSSPLLPSRHRRAEVSPP